MRNTQLSKGARHGGAAPRCGALARGFRIPNEQCLPNSEPRKSNGSDMMTLTHDKQYDGVKTPPQAALFSCVC